MIKNQLKLKSAVFQNVAPGYEYHPQMKQAYEKMKDFKLTTPVKISPFFFILNINKAYNYTRLTPNFNQKLQDYLNVFQQVLFSNWRIKYKIFSAGTHFKDLRKYCLQNNIQNLRQHLNSLQYMSFYTSCYDKPMIVNLQGTLANSAAAVFSNFHFTVTSDENLKFKFDSIEYNSTPLGGELFVLKNLPNKMGLYLALIGGELTLSDLLKYKLIYGIADIDENTINKLKKYTFWEPTLKSYDLNKDYTNDTRLLKKKDIEWTIEEFLDRSQNENPQKVLLDLYYRKNIIEHANIKQRMKQQKSYQINNKYDRRVVETENNHLEFEKFINKHLEFQNFELENSETEENKIKIFRIFQKEKIEDILLALEEDGSEFAIKTFSILKKRNKHLMQVYVDMFRVAEDKTFVECMELEYSTLLQLFNNEQFRQSAFLFGQNLDLQTNIEIKEQDETFKLINHRKDLLPTRNYYKEFPEAFLCYLNQTDLQNPYQCLNYMQIVKGNLFRVGVDYLNPTYDREEVKTKLGLFFSQQEKLHKKFQEFHDFISDKQMFNEHLSQRKEAINSLISQDNFEQFLNQMIEKIQQQNFNDEQELVEKRVQELMRVEQGKNINNIKNFFVKTFFTKPNNNSMTDDIIFSNQTLLDIGSDRFSLSPRYSKKINFQKIKKKYSAKHKISPNELENYIKNKDMNVQSELQQKKSKNAYIDWSKQYVKRDNYQTRKRKWKTNLQLADYIHQRGLPTAEINFREKMVENLKETFERTCRVLNEEEQQEFEKHVLDTFFVDYKQFEDFRDLMNHALHNLLTFHKPIIGKQKVKLQDFNNIKKEDDIVINFDEQKIEQLKNLIFLEKREKIDNHNFLVTCNSLKEYLTQSEFLSEIEKQQFQTLFNTNNKFIQEFQVNCQKDFDKKMDELSNLNNNLIKDFDNQLNFLQINYDLELRNYILPNIFYKNAKKFLKKIQIVYDKIQNECKFQDQKKIQQILIDEQIFDNNEIDLQQLDQQIKLLVSIISQTKYMLTDRDLIIDRQYDVIQEGLKNIVSESDKVQQMVQYIHDKVLVEEEEDAPEYSMDSVQSILTTKEDLKQFLERHQLQRRKNWNPIFKEVISMYQDLVQDSNIIYEQQKGLKELQDKYKNNVDSIADKLLAEGIVIDYHPFTNLLSFYDKIQNKIQIQELKQDDDNEFYDQFFFIEKQNIDQSNTKFLNTTAPTIIQIEKLTKRLAHRGSSAMDVYLKNTKVPFLKLIEESGEEWVMDQLQNILKDIFLIRKKIESKLTQDELINLDLQISKIMNKEYIKQALTESYHNYQFELEDIRMKVQNFYHLDQSNKQESKDKVQRFKEFDPIKDLEYLKLALSYSLATINCNDYQDFNLEEIENDFGDLFKNPKKFMRKRKLWNIKPGALKDETTETFINTQEYSSQDYSDIYSHASKIMFEKYKDTQFKREDTMTNDVITTLNKKADVILTN